MTEVIAGVLGILLPICVIVLLVKELRNKL